MAKKKKKYGAIKSLIRKTFADVCSQKGIEAGIGSRTFKDGVWHCTWGADVPFPEGFDTSIRDTAMEEIQSYMEAKYAEIVEILRECFGEIQHSREQNSWYNFTFHLPPMHIAIPERWEHVDGEFKKVEDARLLTEEELEARLRYFEEQGKTNRYFAMDAELLKWERENWHKYFRFVGGSPFTDELFEYTNYAGIRMFGEFSFKAFDHFLPKESLFTLDEVKQAAKELDVTERGTDIEYKRSLTKQSI